MNWINDTQKAINYIEANLLENINADDVSKHVHSSTDYFQKTFSIVTGLSISEYIRNRRLTLAGEELKNTQAKVIDVSLKYGYDSPESFTKAFARFHGVTPASARASSDNLKHFYPLSINIYIKGGFNMKRKIIPDIPDITYYGNETDYSVNLLAATFSIAGTKMDRAELAFYSGMANHFCWVEGDWVRSRGCECFGNINETPFQEELRLLKTIGWSAKYVVVSRDKDGTMLNTDEEQIKRDFVESIDKGFPILLKRINTGTYSITIGYEDDGKKIVCKEAVGGGVGEHKDAETFVYENWHEVVLDYIVLNKRLEPVPERQRVLEQLKLITAHARRTDKIKV
jgi:AraC-like DNA-binding protein